MVMHAKPHKEDSLWGELCAWGIECFYPRIRVRTVNPRARKIRPFFPGYLFLNVDADSNRMAELRWLPGTNGLVHFGEEPATVPDNIIKGIRSHVDQLNARGDPINLNGLKTGERVEILDGPFFGYEALFDTHISGSLRARVFLQWVKSAQLPVEMPSEMLRRKKRSQLPVG